MTSPITAAVTSTVRIECVNGAASSIGTGFLYQVTLSEDERFVMIVTNKHVVSGMADLNTTLTIGPHGSLQALPDDLRVAGLRSLPIQVPLRGRLIDHPDPSVDLCAVALGPEIEAAMKQGHLRHLFLDSSWLADAAARATMTVVEPVVMIGYPSGLWDKANNLPLTRSGLTGSHPLLDWDHRRQFVVDLACFPGSSGSPVFLYESMMFKSGPNAFSVGTRIVLLGVLWGGPMISLRGTIEHVTIPTGTQAVPVVNAMMNLGYVIRADLLLELETELKNVLGR